MAEQQSTQGSEPPRRAGTKKGITPPKGRPTRARSGVGRRRRAFGPVAQWVAIAGLVIMVIVVAMMLTGGGTFDPFGDDTSGTPAVVRP
jgi:hypothetical protein